MGLGNEMWPEGCESLVITCPPPLPQHPHILSSLLGHHMSKVAASQSGKELSFWGTSCTRAAWRTTHFQCAGINMQELFVPVTINYSGYRNVQSSNSVHTDCILTEETLSAKYTVPTTCTRTKLWASGRLELSGKLDGLGDKRRRWPDSGTICA